MNSKKSFFIPYSKQVINQSDIDAVGQFLDNSSIEDASSEIAFSQQPSESKQGSSRAMVRGVTSSGELQIGNS